MNAVIKLNNMHHLQVLEELLLSKIQIRDDKITTVRLPFYNFVSLLTTIFVEYSKHGEEPLNMFIMNYFVTHQQMQQAKYSSSSFELYRHMAGFIQVWRKYIECHEQARLFLSVMQSERSNRQSVKLFLKIRKAILRNLGTMIMQQIFLKHEDIITISHTIFSPEMKAYAGKKIHELFFNLKKRTIYSNNKINGAVICQFFMNCAEKFERQELKNIKVYYEHAPEQTEDYVKRRIFKPISVNEIDLFDQKYNNESLNAQEIGRENQVEKANKLSPPKWQRSQRQNNFLANNLPSLSSHKQDPLGNAREIIDRRYSNSWQKFLQTNQEMKQKLLKGRQFF